MRKNSGIKGFAIVVGLLVMLQVSIYRDNQQRIERDARRSASTPAETLNLHECLQGLPSCDRTMPPFSMQNSSIARANARH